METVDDGGVEVGSQFDGLRLTERLGAGGWGVVYRAYDSRLARGVAVKVMLENVAADPENRRRFLRESQLLAQVRHPNVLAIHHLGEVHGLPYFVMDLVSGGSLRDLLSGGTRLAPARAVRLLSQLAEALGALHDMGIVHRDVKPANILIESQPGNETARLADFGLAQRSAAGASTATGPVGTFEYMAPEQRRGLDAGPEADVYALGLVFFNALTGYLPDVADRCPPPNFELDDPALAHRLWQVCVRAMAADRSERYRDARAMAAEARTALVGSAPACGPVAASGPASALPSLDLQPLSSATLGPSRTPPDRPARVVRLSRIAALGGVSVAVLLVAVVWLVIDDRSTERGGFSTGTQSVPSNGVVPSRYVVCAKTLDLRQSPMRKEDTRILGTLVKGDIFEVIEWGSTWLKGHSPRLGTGWIVRQDRGRVNLKPSCES